MLRPTVARPSPRVSPAPARAPSRARAPIRAPAPAPRASPAAEFLVNQSAIIGQGIVYFTLFYTTANWWYYRRTREDAEAARAKAEAAEAEKAAKKRAIGLGRPDASENRDKK